MCYTCSPYSGLAGKESMRTKTKISWAIVALLALAALADIAGPVSWAASDPSLVGQTVPTRTPSPGPATPLPPSPEPPTPTPADVALVTPTIVLLPESGSTAEGPWPVLGTAGLVVVALAWSIRRVRRQSRVGR